MKMLVRNYFLDMIRHLRMNEEVMLYANIFKIEDQEREDVKTFLHMEYSKEALTHPYSSPSYNSDAALWAAEVVYFVAQLILYREQKATDMAALFKDYDKEISTSAMLSADLCLRFLPQMLFQLKAMDMEDPLIPILENQLKQWHYSAVNYIDTPANLDFSSIVSSPCLLQLYVNRIIELKKINFARDPLFADYVGANLGMYTQEFWKNYTTETNG